MQETIAKEPKLSLFPVGPQQNLRWLGLTPCMLHFVIFIVSSVYF